MTKVKTLQFGTIHKSLADAINYEDFVKANTEAATTIYEPRARMFQTNIPKIKGHEMFEMIFESRAHMFQNNILKIKDPKMLIMLDADGRSSPTTTRRPCTRSARASRTQTAIPTATNST